MVARYPRLLLCVCLWSSVAVAAPAIDLARFDEPADSEFLAQEQARLDRELARRPKEVALLVRRGEIRFKRHDFDEAAADFTAALKLDDRLDEAYFGRGMALGRGGRVEEGIRDLGVYLARHPRSSLAHTKRGVRYLWLGDLDRAQQDFEKALALDPDNAEAHDDLGVIHAQRGEYERAEHHFLTTVRVEPSYQKGHHNLAMIYFITGKNAQALAAVNRGIALSPQARDSLLLKGAILDALGRHKEAAALREEAEFLPEGERSSRLPIR
jgi:tetratricopeptide (TPR) repeat protein